MATVVMPLAHQAGFFTTRSPSITSHRRQHVSPAHLSVHTHPRVSSPFSCPQRAEHSTRRFLRPAAASGSAETSGPAEPLGSAEASDTPPAKETFQQRVARLGLAAVLAYGLLDGVTYTTFFVVAFLGFERSTGRNPATDLKGLLSVVLLMWTANNVTRPFRVAGAAAASPVLDRMLTQLQEKLRLPNQFAAFVLVVAAAASLCLSVVGLLILSRLGVK